jgi:hypothetical protein
MKTIGIGRATEQQLVGGDDVLDGRVSGEGEGRVLPLRDWRARRTGHAARAIEAPPGSRQETVAHALLRELGVRRR